MKKKSSFSPSERRSESFILTGLCQAGVSSLFLIGIFLILTSSCKKEDNNKNTITDVDGNAYNTVTIGTQVWMVENLKTTHYRNGDPIPNITDDTAWSKLTTGAYCDYGNTASNSNTYGKLYNWYAVNDNRNIAPSGWHIPSDAEWTTLVINLGGDSLTGNKLKESGITHWQSPNTGATNLSGFTALPGGYRLYNGDFNLIGFYGSWWSSTDPNTLNAWTRDLSYNNSNIRRNYFLKTLGFSVRCLKD